MGTLRPTDMWKKPVGDVFEDIASKSNTDAVYRFKSRRGLSVGRTQRVYVVIPILVAICSTQRTSCWVAVSAFLRVQLGVDRSCTGDWLSRGIRIHAVQCRRRE